MTDLMTKGPAVSGVPATAQKPSFPTTMTNWSENSLFAPDEPPPFVLANPDSDSPCLFVCDHASNRIPASLNQLGLSNEAAARHIAWDIGACEVTRILAATFEATAVLASYSRLVVDCNRNPADETSIREVSDFQDVPGNQDLSDGERVRRVDQIFWPYHNEIKEQLIKAGELANVAAPVLISVHSFTPVFQGFERPWQVGVLWDQDPRIAAPLMAGMREEGVLVGDNEPYSGKHPHDFTVDHHAESTGFPYVSLEIRQDLIGDAVGQAYWAGIVAKCLSPILAEPGLYRRLDATTMNVES